MGIKRQTLHGGDDKDLIRDLLEPTPRHRSPLHSHSRISFAIIHGCLHFISDSFSFSLCAGRIWFPGLHRACKDTASYIYFHSSSHHTGAHSLGRHTSAMSCHPQIAAMILVPRFYSELGEAAFSYTLCPCSQIIDFVCLGEFKAP